LISQRCQSRVPTELIYDSATAAGEKRVHLLNEYFSNNFCVHSNPLPPAQLQPICSHSLSSLSTSSDEVRYLLSSLPLNRSPGSDNISAIFVRNAAESLAYPFSRLLNRCFAEGIFPSSWKQPNIIPILKSGDKTHVSSYRHIPLFSILSVVFERIIKDRLYNFVSPYLDSAQHGFLSGSSTLTNLSLLLSDATQSLSNNTQLDVIYLDLSKAFDIIDCNLLLHQLTHRFNNHGNFLSLL